MKQNRSKSTFIKLLLNFLKVCIYNSLYTKANSSQLSTGGKLDPTTEDDEELDINQCLNIQRSFTIMEKRGSNTEICI